MLDTPVYRLVSCFTASIVIWALFAYTELWVNHNIKNTRKILARLLNSETRRLRSDPPDYAILSGYYRGRKIVCRLSNFSASLFLHYNLRLHFHIEPSSETKILNKIDYDCTSLTAIKSYFLSSLINPQEFIHIFEELTLAAEMAEA